MIVARRRSTCPVVEGESHSSNSERCTRSPSVNSPGTLSCYDFAADASAEGKDANASYRSSAFLDCEKPRPRPTRDARPDEGHRTSWLGVRARAREAPRFHGTPPPSLRTGKARSDPHIRIRAALPAPFRALVLFFILNREDFSFVIHLDRQPRTSRRREAQTGSRARSGSRSERTLDAVEHSRTLMEWWPFLIFHRGGLRIKVINNSWEKLPEHRRPHYTPH